MFGLGFLRNGSLWPTFNEVCLEFIGVGEKQEARSLLFPWLAAGTYLSQNSEGLIRKGGLSQAPNYSLILAYGN